MARAKTEQKEQKLDDFTTDNSVALELDTDITPDVKVAVLKEVKEETEVKENNKVITRDEDDLINCLSNETIIVRFIAKARGVITDPKHVLYGNMAPKSKMRFPVPMLRSGVFADVLTKAEKNFLEWKLGLEKNALSVYNRTNNFWSDSNPSGIGRVELTKGDNYFDMSKPMDYIKVAILRSYTDIIAPSLQVLQDNPKATYRFVIIKESETAKAANERISYKAQAYKEFGKIEDNDDKMRTIIEIIEGKGVDANSKNEFLKGMIGDIIESNTKLFLSVARDPYLDNKVIIKKAINKGIISNRGGYLYVKEGNQPMCGDNQEPTLNAAAKFLSLPKNQELKYSIEAKLNE